jgi:outer membrane autotransporter protein
LASASSVLGVELSHRLDIGSKWPLLLTLRGGWGHDFADIGRSINASFEGTRGPAFTVNGAPAARDWAVVETGLTVRVKGVDLFVTMTAWWPEPSGPKAERSESDLTFSTGVRRQESGVRRRQAQISALFRWLSLHGFWT